jgi:cell division protein ZapE
MNVQEYYQHALTERSFKSDAAQQAAVDRLQQAYDDWVQYKAQRSSAFRRLINRPDVPRGVYMWGGVGRGQLDELKGVADPLDEVAKRIARKYRLICFDEFHVSDIADAMILYNLLSSLFANGVSFVMTSNYEPSTLYPDGLHRDRMLPTIALLKDKLDILNVDAGNDYRKRAMEQVQAYYTPLNAASDHALREAYAKVADTADESPIVHIEKREIRALRHAGGVIWFDFATLCGGPRSQNDYLELATRFHTVILSGIPAMSAGQSSEARRFTWLIDVFYDHKVKLIMSAAVEPEALYTQGMLANEFHRTVSRIIEMQSREYMLAERRGAADAIA